MFAVNIMPQIEIDWMLLAISPQGKFKRVLSISLSTVEARVYFLVVSHYRSIRVKKTSGPLSIIVKNFPNGRSRHRRLNDLDMGRTVMTLLWWSNKSALSQVITTQDVEQIAVSADLRFLALKAKLESEHKRSFLTGSMVRVSAVTKVSWREITSVFKHKGFGGEIMQGGCIWRRRGCSCNECGDHGKIAAERPEEKMTFLKWWIEIYMKEVKLDCGNGTETRGLLYDGLAGKTGNQRSVMDHGRIAILVAMEDSTLIL